MRGKISRRATGVGGTRPVPGEYRLNALEQQMADDLDWAETDPEVLRHEGQLVAVHRKRIVGVGADRDELVARAAAREQCPPGELVVVAVPRAGLCEIPR